LLKVTVAMVTAVVGLNHIPSMNLSWSFWYGIFLGLDIVHHILLVGY